MKIKPELINFIIAFKYTILQGLPRQYREKNIKNMKFGPSGSRLRLRHILQDSTFVTYLLENPTTVEITTDEVITSTFHS